MFNRVTPESIGIASEKILRFTETLNSYGINTHSFIMARGNNIFAESYYEPYNENTLHRMYSVSKSFVAIAVGLAEQEGLLSLDDNFLDYFPEYVNENIDDQYRKTTIRDMLTMRSCMAKYAQWWGQDDRAKAYFSVTSNQVPGTNFFYDSSGSFLLGCIVEKVTGKLFLEYLKEKVLLEIGFSKESYCLLAPGGHSHSDSGVMCTTRDMLIFARFVMNGGVWNGKRYINEEFMRAAVSKQTDNNIRGITSPLYNQNGYGYLIWKMPRDGFAFIGMADQLVICDPQTDFIFVITAEDMTCEEITRTIITHELYYNIIPYLGEPLEENASASNELSSFLNGQKMLSLSGSVENNIAQKISGNEYILVDNPLGIKSVSLYFNDDSGVFKYNDANGENCIEFGIGYNKFSKFPGNKRMSITASVYEEGNYDCGASAIWCEEDKLRILVRVIDTYIGTLSIVIGFKNDEITITMQKHAQRILDGLSGTFTGKLKKQNPAKLSNIFCDGMVLQAGKTIRVYGEGSGDISGNFLGETQQAKFDGNKWMMEFKAHEYGGPYSMEITLNNETITISDIMIGEVVLCIGQSNMLLEMYRTNTPHEEYETDDLLRTYTVRLDTKEFKWIHSDKDNISNCSAIAYLVGKNIRKKLNCAVGMVIGVKGASIIQSWINPSYYIGSKLELPIDRLSKNYLKGGGFCNEPGYLYKNILESILPYSFSKAIWYQGESNSNSPHDSSIYCELLQLFAYGLRKDCNDDSLPLCIVQLPDIDDTIVTHVKSEYWKNVQSQQEKAASLIENTTFVESRDICENDNIHPLSKLALSKRIFETIYK